MAVPPPPVTATTRLASGGSNYGPTNQKLVDRVNGDLKTARAENPGFTGPAPSDLVTASGSGLDPDISPASAEVQVARVAAARSVSAGPDPAVGGAKHRGPPVWDSGRTAGQRFKAESLARPGRSPAKIGAVAELSRRPDPEELLRRVQAEERRERRGRLKVFLGYAPRVGKSFRMFDEGRRRKERGEDVVVASIQGDITPEIQAILSQLEVIPTLNGTLRRPRVPGDRYRRPSSAATRKSA